MTILGVGLAAIGSLCEEASSSIGKKEMRLRKESPVTFGLLNATWGIAIALFLIFFVRRAFIFSETLIPFVALRMMLEIFQAHATVRSIAIAQRSTFGLIRVLTIPLLLAADVFFDKEMGTAQIVGVSVVTLSMIVFFLNHGFHVRGARLVLFTAVNAVFTTLLFRYTITHGNSVEVETLISSTVIAVYFFFQARRREHRNPFIHLRNPIVAAQSAAYGASSIVLGFALLLAPTSVIMAVKRSSAVVWSALSGTAIFHERDRFVKLFSAALAAVGVALLVL